MPLLRPRLLPLWVALSAGLLALGAKLSLISSRGSDVPYMDEWDAVGTSLLVPAARHTLGVSNFLAAQNEHRVVLSRLLSFGLIRANGQWDGLVEMSVNAVLHAALLAALIAFSRRLLRGWRFAFAALLSTLLFVLAFDWENTLQGFQSQFYLLEWSALGTFLCCAASVPLSALWWLGWLTCLAGLGTMSSGFLAPLAALAVLLLRSALARRLDRRTCGAAALLLLPCAVGLLAIVRVPGHEALRAHSVLEWLSAACRALSWPQMSVPVAFLILQLPMAALIGRRVSERRLRGDESVLVALGLWAWLQVAVLAYGRANQGMIQSPRYSDLYAIGCIANLLALGILWRPGPSSRPWALFAALWAFAFLCGLWSAEERANTYYLRDFSRLKPLEKQHVRDFVETGDRGPLARAPRHELPYPMPDGLADLLAEPAIRSVLPVSVRPALRTEPLADSAGFTAATDPATGARVWTAARGPARFVGPELPIAVLPFVRIAVRGSPDLLDSALRFEPADGGAPEAPLGLDAVGWRVRELRLPASSSARLVVELPAGNHWIAFSEPQEVGRLSWLTHWVLRRSGAFTAAGGILFGMALTALLLSDLRMGEPNRAVPSP